MLTGPELGAAIEAARIAKNISKKALAGQFGVQPPSIQTWVKYGRIDKSKLIELISFFADTVPASHWGLTAKEADLVAVASVEKASSPSPHEGDDEYVHVPLKSARGAMGRGYENPYVEVKGHLAFKRSWIMARGLNVKYLEAFYADGWSMHPTINDGDVVLLNKAQKEPIHNTIFALNGADGVIIKRLSHASAVNQWGLISDNLDKREFPDQWLDEDDEQMSLLGQIVWRGGDL